MLIVGGHFDSDVECLTEMDSNAGTSRYQLNRAPLTVLNCVVNLVDIKRTWNDDDEEPAKRLKKRKFRRIETNGSDSSQTTHENDDSDDDVLQLMKKRKALPIKSSDDDSEDNLPLAVSKQKLIAERKMKKGKTSRIVRPCNDSDSSSDDLPLVKRKQMDSGSTSGEETEESFEMSDSDDSQVSSERRNASASSSSSADDDDDDSEESTGALVIDEDEDDEPSWRKALQETLTGCAVFNRSLITTESSHKNKREAEYKLQESLTVTKLKEIQKEFKLRPKKSKKAKQPELVALPLMPHQLQGLKFMLWRETCPIAGGMICKTVE